MNGVNNSQPKVTVIFLPDRFVVEAAVGDTVLDAALDNGIEIAHDCGGNCACTTCHIRVEAGLEFLSPMEPVEDERLSTADARTQSSRLACQALLLDGPISVTPLETW